MRVKSNYDILHGYFQADLSEYFLQGKANFKSAPSRPNVKLLSGEESEHDFCELMQLATSIYDILLHSPM